MDGSTLCGADGSPGAGIEHYTVSLLSALVEESPDDFFFVCLPEGGMIRSLPTSLRRAKNVRWLPRLLPRLPFVSQHLFFPLRAAALRPDLFFSPYGQLPLGWRRGRSVVTVHDVSIFDHSQWFPSDLSDSFSTQFIVPDSFTRASAIICVSAWTQSRLHARFPITKTKTSVVYEGVEFGHHKQVEYTDRFPFDRDYLLCLGTIEPRKNLKHAFTAFDQFLQIHPELSKSVRLIVAGKQGWNVSETEQIAKTVNEHWQQTEPAGVIQFLGPVTEEEKWYLLSRASGLLFPSYEEGFGLPILEAMSVGTPVITTTGSATEEIAGDAAMLVDAEDVQALSFSIAQCFLVPEGIQSMREDGYRRAKRFSWQRAAKETLDVFHKTLSKKD